MKMEKRGLVMTIAVFALLLLGACMLLNYVDGASDEAQISLVREAVRKAAVTCYAIEGSYPQDIAYLKEHYGLAYNESRYIIVYDAFASNIMPDIRVLVKGASQL